MTNREESNAAEHETFPGPGPLRTDEAKRSIRPVEQMVDAAIERIARETEARAARAGKPAARAAAEPGHALTLTRSDAAALMARDGAEEPSAPGGQLALASDERGKGRLRWKGLDVSDEFRSYAERVARGEDLPPFTGKILAEPDPAFPWDPTAQKRAARKALKQQIGLWTGVVAFLGISVAVLVVQVRKQTDAWQAPASPLASVTLTNQPSTQAAPDPLAGENAPAAFNEGALGETALAEAATPASAGAVAPVETKAPAAPAISRSVSAPRPPAASTGVASAPRPVAPPAASGSGLATSSSATSSVAASSVAASSVSTSSAATSSAGSLAATPGASAGEPAVKAFGTGGVVAGGSVLAATDVAGADDSASALRADPKKEPTREASGMGSLLVESPSF